MPPSIPDKLAELQKLWFAEAEKYNGLPLSDLNVFEMVGRWRPSLAGDRPSYVYYPHTAPVAMGACVSINGRSFSVLAEVSVDSPDVQGVLLKQGAGHGGYVLFVADGRLQFVYNFFGEDEQRVIAPDPVPLGDHILGVGYARTGTVEGSHTPLGDVTLYVDGAAVATLPGVKAHPLHVRIGRWRCQRGSQSRAGGVHGLSGAVRLQRRNHRPRCRRRVGHSLRRRGAPTRGGLRQGLTATSYW